MDWQPRDGFTGLLVPVVTPMQADGRLDPDGIASLARHIAGAKGVAGLVTSARIGEGPVLSWEEQLGLVEAARGAVEPGVPIIAAILPRSAEQAIEQTAALRQAGADAVMPFPPLLLAWGQVPERVKLSFYEDFAAGTELPIVAFQIPIRDYWFEPETLGRIAELPAVVSMKDACFDMQVYGATLEAIRRPGRRMTMLNGNDRFVAEGAIMGAEGALIGIANLLPESWAEILRLAAAGDVQGALELQRRLRPLQELVFREPILDAVGRMKAIFAAEGIISSAHVRRPQLGVDGAELDALISGYRRVREALTLASAR